LGFIHCSICDDSYMFSATKTGGSRDSVAQIGVMMWLSLYIYIFYRQNMKGADCNLDIMPPKKKQNKRSNKVSSILLTKTCKRMCDKLNLKKRTLSKSQKLELKKLEEDREKELLSAKKI
ncbi:unnamed protein product, partial [Brassica oleracea]